MCCQSQNIMSVSMCLVGLRVELMISVVIHISALPGCAMALMPSLLVLVGPQCACPYLDFLLV